MVFNNKGSFEYHHNHEYSCYCLNLHCAFCQYKKLAFKSFKNFELFEHFGAIGWRMHQPQKSPPCF